MKVIHRLTMIRQEGKRIGKQAKTACGIELYLEMRDSLADWCRAQGKRKNSPVAVSEMHSVTSCLRCLADGAAPNSSKGQDPKPLPEGWQNGRTG